MPNVYVIKIESYGYLGVSNTDTLVVADKQQAKRFHCLLDADCYAAAMDMEFPVHNHIVEVL